MTSNYFQAQTADADGDVRYVQLDVNTVKCEPYTVDRRVEFDIRHVITKT